MDIAHQTSADFASIVAGHRYPVVDVVSRTNVQTEAWQVSGLHAMPHVLGLQECEISLMLW